MKSFSSTAPATRTLDQLFSLLASDSLPIAVRHNSSIGNYVTKALPIVIDENAMTAVQGSLNHMLSIMLRVPGMNEKRCRN